MTLPSPEEVRSMMAQERAQPSGLPSPDEVRAMMAQEASYGRRGIVAGTVDAQTSGFADEIYGAGSALMETLTGANKSIPFGEKYKIYRDAMRGSVSEAQQKAPGRALIGQVAGGFLNPLAAGLGSAVAPVKAGALLGGAYGAGAAEGGIEETAKEVAKGAALGGAVSGVVSKAGKALGSLSKGAKTVAGNLRENVLGVRQSDFTRSAKYRGLRNLDGEPETALKEAFRELSEEGFFKGTSANPSGFIKKADAAQTKLSSQIDSIVSLADDARAAKDLVVQPQWKEVARFVESQPVADQEAVRAQAMKLINAQRGLDGSLKSLQNQKVKLNRKVYGENSAISEELDAALTRDIRRTIEEATSVLVPNKAGAIKSLNRKWGQYAEVGSILRRTQAEDEAANPIKSLIAAARTSGGGGVGVLTGSMLGGPVGGAVGLGAGILGTTKTGKLLTSKVLDAAAPAAAKAGGALIGAAPRAGQLGAMSFAGKESQQPQPQGGTRRMDEVKPTRPPTEIAALIEQTAGDPELAKLTQAVIRVESAGDPRAVSRVGAQGLMQLMPEIQKAFSVKDPFDPAENIRGGVSLLKEELGRFGDVRLALAAYNAGSPRVLRAIEKAGSRNWEEVSKHLPTETRNYVPKVLKYIEV